MCGGGSDNESNFGMKKVIHKAYQGVCLVYECTPDPFLSCKGVDQNHAIDEYYNPMYGYVASHISANGILES